MITTYTIEQLCHLEEKHCPSSDIKQERIEWIIQELQTLSIDPRRGIPQVCVQFLWIGGQRVPDCDSMQLACEAVKFHRLRLAGHSLHDAIDRMLR